MSFTASSFEDPSSSSTSTKERFKLDHEQVDHANRDCFMAVFLSHGPLTKRTRNTCAQLTSASVRTNVFVLLLVNGECSEGCICSSVLLTDLTESFITCST